MGLVLILLLASEYESPALRSLFGVWKYDRKKE
jgi:hypothetical protein